MASPLINPWPLRGQRELFVALAAKCLLSAGKVQMFHPSHFEALGTSIELSGAPHAKGEEPQLLVAFDAPSYASPPYPFATTAQLFGYYISLDFIQRYTTEETQKEIIRCLLSHHYRNCRT